jgi:hypothetical protein
MDLDPSATAILTVVANIVFTFPFVLMWLPTKKQSPNFYTDQQIANQVVVLLGWYTSLLALQTLVYKRVLLRARQFHVRSDGAILVETMSKTYLYDNVVSAELEPCDDGVIPKQTERRHVYVGKVSGPLVLIKQKGRRSLYVTPELPDEFANAIASAIRSSSAEGKLCG